MFELKIKWPTYLRNLLGFPNFASSGKRLVSRELDEAQIKEEIEGSDLSRWFVILRQRQKKIRDSIGSVRVDCYNGQDWPVKERRDPQAVIIVLL